MHPLRVTVLSGLWRGYIIGCYFVETEDGATITVNGDTVLEKIIGALKFLNIFLYFYLLLHKYYKEYTLNEKYLNSLTNKIKINEYFCQNLKKI